MPEPVAHAEMLIRRPAQEVFDAFVEPRTLTQFWLSKASAPLAPRAIVRWDFMVAGAAAEIRVETFDRPEKLFFRFGDSKVEIIFKEKAPDMTHVMVSNFGFKQNPVATATESTEGFTLVLADLKTLLESGKSANLVRDKAALIQERMQSSKT